MPGLNYVDTDGTAVNSSACYAAGTTYASTGVASFAGLNNANCFPVQAFRNSIYSQERHGATSSVRWTNGANTLEGGICYERFDRDDVEPNPSLGMLQRLCAQRRRSRIIAAFLETVLQRQAKALRPAS